ncbi:DUF1902 domain-containing protein [Rahnella perminowiae]|uniref:DUF1902 domain-containing protein n=1 Tax=Rahnella TaxID=34037 RepID=UPI0010218F32|nr:MULTISPECIES: DUF1902 domain-containing protein [Rahnella]MCX2942918.1 DUF1902 domain-containing protein [Rahnella perminowiae]
MSKSQLFTINVTHEDRMWTGICDELGLVTEAKSFEQLTLRVRDIAPELCQLNCDVHPDEMRLDFVHEQTLPMML